MLLPRLIILLLAAFVCSFSQRAHGHTADTSYARVRILPDRVETRLTFDAFSLQKIVPDLDSDGDLALSRAELEAATPAITAWLRGNAGIEIDGTATDLGDASPPYWPLDAPDPLPAKLWHANESLFSFPFDKTTAAPARTVALVFAVFPTLGQQHTILGVFEHGPEPHQAVFTAAEPDYLFDTAYAPGASPPSTAARGNVNASPLREFLWQGALHIWIGTDHIAFLLALLVVARPRQLIGIITAFTVAHSITLSLAALHIFTLPPRLIECAIAATIVYVAIENLLRTTPQHRWVLTFAFGLIHGFGFANVLGPLDLPAESFVPCMIAFNIGVELGQIAIVAALIPAGWLIGKSGHARPLRACVSGIVGVFGLAWLVDRIFELELMPF